ncbi:MAG: type IV secretion protein DotN, partial [Micavibrio sp.]
RDFLGPKHYAMRAEKLDGVRLFPLDRRNVSEGELKFNQFPQILAYWRSKDGPFAGILPSNWKTLYAKVKEAA